MSDVGNPVGSLDGYIRLFMSECYYSHLNCYWLVFFLFIILERSGLSSLWQRIFLLQFLPIS